MDKASSLCNKNMGVRAGPLLAGHQPCLGVGSTGLRMCTEATDGLCAILLSIC